MVILSKSPVNHSAIQRHAFYLLLKPSGNKSLQFKARKRKDTQGQLQDLLSSVYSFSHSSLYSPCSAFGTLKAWGLDFRKGSSEAGSQTCSNMEGALDDK